MSWTRTLWICVLVLAWGCEKKAQAPLSNLKPQALPRVTLDPDGGAPTSREELFTVEAARLYGDKPPKDAVRLEWSGEGVRVSGAQWDPDAPGASAELKRRLGDRDTVLVVPDEDVYLARAASLLAVLDDLGVKVWLLAPGGAVAFPITLRDEQAFQAWLDEAKPGKLRIIQRADGFELQSNVGKLPGADPNGPTVPLRGGQWDVARLRRGLQALKGRFTTANDLCVVPSFGIELRVVAQALTGDYTDMGERIYDELCLVYPRPRARDGGR